MIKEVPGTLTIDSSKQTPGWAKTVYRVAFIVTSALSVWILVTNLVPAGAKAELVVGLKFLDTVLYGIAQMLGVDVVATTT